MVNTHYYTCGMCHKQTYRIFAAIHKGTSHTDLCSNVCLEVFRKLEQAIIEYTQDAKIKGYIRVHGKPMPNLEKKED